jgi:sodium-coupled neutral amino acid transporter 11
MQTIKAKPVELTNLAAESSNELEATEPDDVAEDEALFNISLNHDSDPFLSTGELDVLAGQEGGSSIFKATLNFVNSIVGAGVIGLAFALHEAGFWMGILLITVLAIVVDWTVNLLILDSKLASQDSYQGLMYHAFGTFGFFTISLFQFLFAFLAMASYNVIVGDTIPRVLASLIPETWFIYPLFTSRTFIIILITLCVSLPLSLLKDVTKLAQASAVSLLLIAFIVLVVVVEGPKFNVEPAPLTFIGPGFFQAVGIASFAFVCHHQSQIIYGSLKTPTMARFAIVTHLSTGVSWIISITLAISGYLAFGELVKPNVLSNFPNDNVIINIARLCFAINISFTLPLENFVCREVLATALCFYKTGRFDSVEHGDLFHYTSTLGLVFSAMAIALSTCDLGFVLEMAGGLAGCLLAYVLPCALYLKLAPKQRTSPTSIACYVSITFGVLVMILSTGLSLSNFLHRSPDDHAARCG